MNTNTQLTTPNPVGLVARTPDELMMMARTLAASDLVSAAYRGKPSNIFLVGLRAHELGIGLTTALAEMHVIDGKVGMSARLLSAVVRRSTACARLTLVHVDDSEARYEGERRDTGEKLSMRYTYAQAQAAGLTNKTNWRNDRQAMLMARATARLCRELWPDVALGLYVMDELEEIQAASQPAPAEVVSDGRPKTEADMKAHLKAKLSPGLAELPVATRQSPQDAPAAKTASEPRAVEIVQGAPAQQAAATAADDDADPFGDAPRQEEPDDSRRADGPGHPLLDPANWYAPDMGGVDAADDEGLELRLPARLGGAAFQALMGEGVWTIGPLKPWTPAQALMGGEGGGRHKLLAKAVQYAIDKGFGAADLPRGALVADRCLALLEKRYALMRAAGLDTTERE